MLRAERNWSQADLAEKLGVSRQSVNAIETGRFDPSLPLAFKLSKLFALPIETIFSEWKDPKAGKYTDTTPYIPAFRRNLQRMALKDLAYLVQEPYSGPEDARTLARIRRA